MPAAGKTGTSHDGWFAGYTSELLCVVWVGFDDNRELNLEGAHSAAPIWAEFMKRALEYREYRDTKPFRAPAGIVSITIDPESGMPATPACPKTRSEVYIAGTEPVGVCPCTAGAAASPRSPAGTPAPPPATPPPAQRRSHDHGLAGRRAGSAGPGGAPRRAPGRRPGGGPPRRPPPPKEEPKKEKRRRGFSSACCVCLNSSKGAIWLTDLGPSFWRRA